MEISSVLAEALNSAERARRIGIPRGEVEEAALRWELYASLQNVLDATAMIVSDLRLRKPSSYSDLGDVLYEAGLADDDLRRGLKIIAITRNALAHAYRRLSPRDLSDIVKDVLPLVESVVGRLMRILKERRIDPSPCSAGELADVLKDVFERNGVVLAYLFGSRARGLHRGDSDYDIAVLFNRDDVSIVDEVRIAVEISERLRAPVDVVSLNNADVILIARVLKEGTLLYSRSDDVRRAWERHKYVDVLREADLLAVYAARALKQ